MKNTCEYFNEKNILVHEKKITARSGLRTSDFGLQGGFSSDSSPSIRQIRFLGQGFCKFLDKRSVKIDGMHK